MSSDIIFPKQCVVASYLWHIFKENFNFLVSYFASLTFHTALTKSDEEKRVYFNSQFEIIVLHDGQVLVSIGINDWLHDNCIHETESKECCGAQFILSFPFSCDRSVYWMMLPALSWATSDFSSTKPLGNSLRGGQQFVPMVPNSVKLTDKINLHTSGIFFPQKE